MTQYVAFLRAINVGGRRIASDDLAALFEELGFDDVATYLASGNVVFNSAEPPEPLTPRIEAAFDEAHGWDVPTFIRTLDEVGALTGVDVFEPADGQKVYVVFGAHDLEPHQPALDELSNDVDTFVARGHEIFWLRDMEAGESHTTGELEKALGEELTRRTVRTLERLAKKFG
jgi:uncharacterized protein (DUF1697 family)